MIHPQLRPAQLSDLEKILEMMAAFYAIDQYAFDEELSRNNLEVFIGSGQYGKLWIVMDKEVPIGYAVLALAFSFEYGGITAFLDELYLAPDFRNKGLGKQVVEFVLQEARNMGIQSVHLEVEKHNTSARQLYARWGFTDKDRLLLTRKMP